MGLISSLSNITTKYSGITKILKKRIYQNPQALDTFYSATKEAGQAIGTLPKDILSVNASNNLERKEVAKKLNEIFSTISDDLQGFEGKKLETAQGLNLKNFIGTYLPKLAKIDIQPERVPRIISDMRKKLTPKKDIIKQFNETMSARMTGLMQENGVILPSQNARLTYLGQGVFKNAFKFEILDKEGNQLMHPKVLLSFKDEKMIQKENNAILGLLKSYMAKVPKSEFVSKLNKMIEATPTKVIPEDKRGLYKETLIKMYEDINNNNGIQKFENIVNSNTKYQAKYNGILPESNIIMYLKHAAGKPLAKTNFIDISYINPNKRIGLAEYSDDLLPKMTKQVDMDKLGIIHDDLVNNKDNLVGERIIDYGNVKILKEKVSQILADRPIARRYYNKLQQINCNDAEKTQALRVDYWNNLYDKAINHKIPNHNEVLEALQVSKTHITPENYSLLHDFKE